MTDLEETMYFDPDEGIADLDTHLDRLKDAAEAQGFKFDRHAARNELQAATFGKRKRAAGTVAQRRHGDRGADCLSGEREAQETVGNGDERRRVKPDRAQDFRMMGVEPAGQRPEGRHDDLRR